MYIADENYVASVLIQPPVPTFNIYSCVHIYICDENNVASIHVQTYVPTLHVYVYMYIFVMRIIWTL